jgi:hypothetical protein
VAPRFGQVGIWIIHRAATSLHCAISAHFAEIFSFENNQN